VDGRLLLVSWPGQVLAEDTVQPTEEPMAEDGGNGSWNEVVHRVEARISGDVVDLSTCG
jgi:hypothetical protein